MRKFLLLTAFSISLKIFSQTGNDFFKELSGILEKTLVEYKDYSGYKEPYQVSDIKNVFFVPTQKRDSVNIDIINQFYDLQTKMHKQDVGVDLVANYFENFTGGVFDENNIFFNRRFSAGFEWDILKDGFLVSRLHAKESEIDKKIALLKAQKELDGEDNYKIAYNNIIYQFNKEKIEILKFKSTLIDSMLNVYYKMFYLKYTPWEEVIKIINSKATNEQLTNALIDYNKHYDSSYVYNFDASKLPVLNVIIDSVMKVNSTYAQTYLDTIHLLNKKLLDFKYNIGKEISLTPSIRYNIFNTPPENRQFFTAGITFSIPIPIFAGKYKRLKNLESQLMDFWYEKQKKNESQEVSNHNYEYQYKLKQYIDLLFKQSIRQELVRKEISKLNTNNPDYSPIAILKLIDEIISVNYEIIDLKQQLYLKLLKIYFEADLKNVDDCSKLFTYDKSYKDYQAKKSLYIWSSDFLKNDNKYIQEICNANRINHLIISIGSNEEAKNKLINLLADNNHKMLITQMFGNNKMIYFNETEIDNYCKTNYVNGVTAIHIDVEPHTFDDWSSNKIELQNKYINMLKTVNEFCVQNRLLLEVSIPLHYDEDFLKKIYPLVDKVYLMAYENVDKDFIIRKSKEELSINKDKTSIAFRPKDFKNRYDFEKLVLTIESETEVYDIAIHDFSGLINLEDSVINEVIIKQ